MNPETLENGVTIFPNVLDKFPAHLGDRHLDVLSRIQEAYRKQLQTPFYPEDMTAEEFQGTLIDKPELGLNYTLVRRGIATKILRAVTYREVGFGEIFDNIKAGLEGIKDEPLAQIEKQLTENEIRALVRGFQTGEFDASMVDYLLLNRLPAFSIYAGLEGRYHDSLKFDFQGWSLIQNFALSERFSSWASLVLVRQGQFKSHRFIVGDVAGQAGIAAEMNWVGYDLPSQTDLRESVSGMSFLNDNVAEWKYNEYIQPFLQAVTPEEIYGSSNWDVVIQKSRRALIASHEIGHTVHVVPKGTDIRLGEWYQVLREVYGDHFGPFAIARHPEIVIGKNEILPAVYYDLAKAESIIDRHHKRILDEGKQKSLWDPYVYAAAIKINAYLANPKLLERQDNGIYVVKDLNELKPTLREMLKHLDRLTCTGSKQEVEDFINERASIPLDLLAID